MPRKRKKGLFDDLGRAMAEAIVEAVGDMHTRRQTGRLPADQPAVAVITYPADELAIARRKLRDKKRREACRKRS